MLKTYLKRVPGVLPLARAMGLAQRPSQSRQFLLEMLPKNSIGAEIGVHLGEFSARILEVVAPRRLYLIDPWEHQTGDEYVNAWYGGEAEGGQAEMDSRYAAIQRRFANQIAGGQVSICRGYSSEELEKLDDESLDWVYIDGNHLYDFVKVDLEVSFRKVKQGGLVCGDDYTDGGWWKGGVKRAVDEYAATMPGSLIQLKNNQFVFRNR